MLHYLVFIHGGCCCSIGGSALFQARCVDTANGGINDYYGFLNVTWGNGGWGSLVAGKFLSAIAILFHGWTTALKYFLHIDRKCTRESETKDKLFKSNFSAVCYNAYQTTMHIKNHLRLFRTMHSTIYMVSYSKSHNTLCPLLCLPVLRWFKNKYSTYESRVFIKKLASY